MGKFDAWEKFIFKVKVDGSAETKHNFMIDTFYAFPVAIFE